MNFFLPMKRIPCCTKQQKRVAQQGGKLHFYDSESMKAARETFRGALAGSAPDTPLAGPVKMLIIWLFPTSDIKKHHKPKISTPDLDNLAGIFLDSMADVGFFVNDAQVFDLRMIKRWTSDISGVFVELGEVAE